MYKETYTITFGDVAENHVNMEKLGTMSDRGFDLDDLNRFKEYFEKKGLTTVLHDFKDIQPKLATTITTTKTTKKKDEDEEEEKEVVKEILKFNDAYLLVIKNGLSAICSPDEFHKEQKQLDKDKKAFMYGRVVNKNARHNLCFTDGESREPDYENGKGRLVSFKDCKLLSLTRDTLKEAMGEKADHLVAEGNYYFDVSKCGIGYHGDAERRRVIGCRTGARMKLCFNWFIDCKPIGTKFEYYLNHGDIYVMSEYAVGSNWRKKKLPTLRHAAGSNKFTNL